MSSRQLNRSLHVNALVVVIFISILTAVFLVDCAFSKSPSAKLVFKSINSPDGSRLELYQDKTPDLDFLFGLDLLFIHVARDGTASAIWGKGINDGRLTVFDTMEITGDSIPEVISLWEDEGGYWGDVHHISWIDSFNVKIQTVPIPGSRWPWEVEHDSILADSVKRWDVAVSRHLFRTVGDSSIVFKGGFSDCDSIVILFDCSADSLRAVCMGESRK